jgi:hypothetical protein
MASPETSQSITRLIRAVQEGSSSAVRPRLRRTSTDWCTWPASACWSRSRSPGRAVDGQAQIARRRAAPLSRGGGSPAGRSAPALTRAAHSLPQSAFQLGPVAVPWSRNQLALDALNKYVCFLLRRPNHVLSGR